MQQLTNNELIVIFSSIALLISITCLFHTKQRRTKLPPGPYQWPVIGNLLQLVAAGLPPHVTLTKLSRRHGPIMTLWLGSMQTVVVSSSQVAREIFKKHDAALSGRKIYEAMKGEGSNAGSLITAQYGTYWRMLRRLCATQFFVTRQLDAMSHVRSRCVDQMLRFVEEGGQNGTKSIDVGRYFFLMMFNLMGNLMFSRDLLDPESKKGADFFYHTGKVMDLVGKPNVADLFPFLSFLDAQGIRRQAQFHVEKAFDIIKEFERERRNVAETERVKSDEKMKDYLDALLEFRGDEVDAEPSKLSSREINVIIFEMFVAGTETTTSTLEWALAELLHNPRILTKLQTEIRTYTKSFNQKLEEEDYLKLPYLSAVIKETLRFHPPLPFLVPRKALSESHILDKYTIPKETQVLVNVWAMGREPETWDDPNVFKPERFISDPNPKDFKGQSYEFLPFGSGRRICPAVPLVARILPLTLGSMVGSFDWILANGLKAEEMNMGDRIGITLKKAVPLHAIPTLYQGH